LDNGAAAPRRSNVEMFMIMVVESSRKVVSM
jgi:hypothetical protein